MKGKANKEKRRLCLAEFLHLLGYHCLLDSYCALLVLLLCSLALVFVCNKVSKSSELIRSTVLVATDAMVFLTYFDE